MTSHSADPRLDPSLSVDACRRIDALCVALEQSLRNGAPCEVETLLHGWQGAERRALLRELLAVELEFRICQGTTIVELDFFSRFPADNDIVSLVLHEAQGPGIETLPIAESPDEAEVPGFLRDHPRYHIIRRLGAGGMGDVWLAEHAVLGRPVAIKVIRAELLASSEARSRFLGEARAAARLNHPNVVTVHDAEASEQSQFLVMEYLEGADLACVVRDEGPLDWRRACGVVAQAALGLEAAHAAGLVHRDLSPRNLFCTRAGTVKLLDFGLAALTAGAGTAPDEIAGTLLGSIDFMSPEQARDPGVSDLRSDLYSLGCVFHFLLTGRPPYCGKSVAERLAAHAEAPIPNLSDALEIPASLADVVRRLLAKRPEDRIQSPRALILALPDPGPQPREDVASDHGRISSGPGRAARIALGVALLLMVLLATGRLANWFGTGSRQKADPVERALQESRLLLGQRQESQVRAAISRLNTLVTRSPDSGEGFAALAEAWNLMGDYGWEDAGDCFPRAIAAAERALELDNDLAVAHLALAFAWHSYECDWPKAEAGYRRALELDTDSASAHHWYAWLLVQTGRSVEAREHVLIAHELAPFDLIVMNNVGKIIYYCHDFAEAARWHRKALDLDPDFRKGHLDLGYALVELGETAAAIQELEQAKGLWAGDDDIAAARAYALARAGQLEQARAICDALEPAAQQQQRMTLELARLRAALGDRDSALQWLERAFELRSPGRANLKVDPRWSPLRGDPQFNDFVGRLRFP